MKTIFTFLLITTTLIANAQNRISGKVTTTKGEPLPGVNVFIENTYDGASIDTTGFFSFPIRKAGKNLKAIFNGYKV